MSDEEKPKNVITANFGSGETKMRGEYGARCRHSKYELDESERTITCGLCGASLDAFTLLLEYARRERNWRYFEVEERKTRERISALEDDERKIKARVRSARRKDAELAVKDERDRLREQNRRTAGNARQILELAQRIVNAHDEYAAERSRADTRPDFKR